MHKIPVGLIAFALLPLASCQSGGKATYESMEASSSSSSSATTTSSSMQQKRSTSMDLGAFSISLAVKDLAASHEFYKKLGFDTVIGGSPAQNYLILQNGTTLIGLFQGMFENNILTFNPGWDHNGKNVDPFTDVREIQSRLKAEGWPFAVEADATTNGPASFVIVDPDGNAILVDQHR